MNLHGGVPDMTYSVSYVVALPLGLFSSSPVGLPTGTLQFSKFQLGSGRRIDVVEGLQA